MNWSEHDNDAAAQDTLPADETPQEEDASALFAGDCGELPLATRRVLVQLLLGPAIDGQRQSKLWPVLLRDEALIRRRLSELFLDLVVDPDQQVAFTRQAEVGDLDAPVLLRRSPLTFIDSLLMLFLRQKLTQADVHGERAVVDSQEVLEHLTVYEHAANTDHAGFGKKVQASVEKMKKNSILHKIRGSEERYEVSPTLKLLFSAEEILELTRQYQALASAGASKLAADPEADDQEQEEES